MSLPPLPSLGAAVPAIRSLPLSVAVPLPPPGCNPNVRMHEIKRSRIRRSHKVACHGYLIAQGVRQIKPAPNRFRVTLTLVPKERRTRDKDNFLSSCKGLLDALAQVLGVDDSRFDPIPRIAEADPKDPRVIVTVEGVEGSS